MFLCIIYRYIYIYFNRSEFLFFVYFGLCSCLDSFGYQDPHVLLYNKIRHLLSSFTQIGSTSEYNTHGRPAKYSTMGTTRSTIRKHIHTHFYYFFLMKQWIIYITYYVRTYG